MVIKIAAKTKEAIQPEINIGLVGHVDHGKTTLTEKLSGKWTDTHSEEIKRGITIRLGYADAVFYKCSKCRGPEAYSLKPKCNKCGSECKLLRKVSFVDAPGHESLMATMLSGSTIMDGALLIIAANERCPQPQTREHLMALQIAGIKHLVIIQNKVDLVNDEMVMANYNQVKEFLKGTDYEEAPIIPVSAQHNVNVNAVIEAIEKNIPTPKLDTKQDPIMCIARSFDINKPGCKIDNIVGGVLGGVLKQGILKVNDVIEIRPGRAVEERNQRIWKPITTTISALKTGGKDVKQVAPGGSIGVMTKLDPSIVKSDGLAGNLLGKPDKLPPVLYDLKLETYLLERVVGSKEELEVEPIKMHEPLMLNVNSSATVGIVTNLSKGIVHCKLKLAICAEHGSRITISRRLDNRFRLIGYGLILK